jgi:hypothetical protein
VSCQQHAKPLLEMLALATPPNPVFPVGSPVSSSARASVMCTRLANDMSDTSDTLGVGPSPEFPPIRAFPPMRPFLRADASPAPALGRTTPTVPPESANCRRVLGRRKWFRARLLRLNPRRALTDHRRCVRARATRTDPAPGTHVPNSRGCAPRVFKEHNPTPRCVFWRQCDSSVRSPSSTERAHLSCLP